VPGTFPSCAYICGKAGAGSKADAENLANDINYSVGIAAFDNLGNVGRLSSLACASPQAVDDFFDFYKNAGGTGGGCGCSVAGRGDVVGGGLLLGGLAYVTALRRRRRRTR
jgi:MYXO-CTERM domain-containing protein